MILSTLKNYLKISGRKLGQNLGQNMVKIVVFLEVAAEVPVSAITVTLIDFICGTDNSGAIHMHFKVISYHMLLFLDL